MIIYLLGEKKHILNCNENSSKILSLHQICPSQNIQNMWNLRLESARDVDASDMLMS